MTDVIVAKAPVNFTRREIRWLMFYVWLVQHGRCTEFLRIGPN